MPSTTPTAAAPLSGRAAVAYDRFVALERAVRAADYCGWELDDLLASPIVRAATLGNLFLRRVAIQVGERSFVNLRPLLRVPKLPSTKANGFFARGYLRAFRATGDTTWLDRGLERLDALERTRASGPGYAWGNDFDFASRAGLFRAGTPTVVWTALIGEAFLLAHEITGDDRHGSAVIETGRFVLDGLERHEDADGVCLAYAPGLVPLVHNSNLLGAVTLLRAWSRDDDAAKLELARSSVRWSLAHMRSDGSWLYGVGPSWGWIDSFHTAYVIDCLSEVRRLTGGDLVPDDAIDRSVDYWKRTFLRNDGTVAYYHDRTYPLDIQCAAQAIETLAKRAPADPEAASLAAVTLDRTVTTFGRADGFFEYRRGRLLPKRLVSLHWGQGTMLSALGCLLETSSPR